MHVVANGLCALPTGLDAAKQGPSKVRQFLGVAVAAGQQERQDIIRQIADSPLPRVWAHLVGQTTVLDEELAADLQQTCRGNQSRTNIAKKIKKIAGFHARRKLHRLVPDDV